MRPINRTVHPVDIAPQIIAAVIIAVTTCYGSALIVRGIQITESYRSPIIAQEARFQAATEVGEYVDPAVKLALYNVAAAESQEKYDLGRAIIREGGMYNLPLALFLALHYILGRRFSFTKPRRR